jgi:hypothetical protein
VVQKLVPDEVHILPNEGGDYIISRDGEKGEVIVTSAHIINLAKSLPILARQILQELHGPRSSSHLATISGANVEKISIQHDLLGETVLLLLTDTHGMESPFSLPLAKARNLGAEILNVCVIAEAAAQNAKQ